MMALMTRPPLPWLGRLWWYCEGVSVNRCEFRLVEAPHPCQNAPQSSWDGTCVPAAGGWGKRLWGSEGSLGRFQGTGTCAHPC